MTTNKYFNNGSGLGTESEQDISEDNIIEVIQMAGHDVYYIPRTLFAEDKFFNEVTQEVFNDYHKIEMYINNITDFGGQGDYMSKFGLNVEDTVEFLVSRKRYLEETTIVNPSEGDLIYFPLSKHLFQIDFVEDEPGNAGSINQFYQLSRLYTFLLKCTLFDYSYEEFDTGIEILDDTFKPDTYTPKEYDRQEEINTEAEDTLDFSESNPFGTTVDRD